MELALHIGSFKVETKGDLWLQISRWTFYYRREWPKPQGSWKRFDAWRSQDDARYVGWAVRFLNRQLQITKTKTLTPEQEGGSGGSQSIHAGAGCGA